jgi:hypothetical protein
MTAPAAREVLPMCATTACSCTRAGHETLPIQTRVASASPTGWLDAVVTEVAAGGWIEARLVADDHAVALWHHEAVFALHEPIAVHAGAGLAHVGGRAVSVARR